MSKCRLVRPSVVFFRFRSAHNTQIARTLGKIRQFQKAHYNFEVVDIVRKYLKGISQPSDAELYALSQQREEKGDESQAGTGMLPIELRVCEVRAADSKGQQRGNEDARNS